MNVGVAIKGALPMVAIWFATHCGGGFATGNQEANYYVKFGWYSLFLPMIAMFLVGWGHRNALILAKDHKAYDYKTFCDVLFHPYEKYFSLIFELSFVLLAFFAISGSIAAAGSLLENTLGIAYSLGIVLVGLLMIFLTIFGSEFVVKVLKYQTYFLVGTLFLICLAGFIAGIPNLEKIVIAKETFGFSFGDALHSAILYVGFQAFSMLPIISVAQKIKTDTECNWFMFFGVLLNGTFLILVCAMLLAFSPESLTQELPVFYVASNHIDVPFLKLIYSFIIFIALISTVLSMIYSVVARFDTMLQKKKIIANDKIRRAFITTTSLIVCTLISTLGLTTIVVKGYGTLGYIGIALMLLPSIVIGTIKIKRNKNKQNLQ